MSFSPRLGAHWDGSGVNFAIYSGGARQVELCLFDSANGPESRRILLSATSNGVWHAQVSGVWPGQHYGYRVDGPYAPHEGQRFNSAKLLLDPYAKAMTGPIPADDVLLGYDVHRPDLPDARDSAPVMPKCVVVDEKWDWGDDRHPRTSWAETVLYECHVKGMTKLHPEVDPELRGTYLGLASPPIIEHLLRLGVTAVSLLPVQYFVNERRLTPMGLVNYWGYNTIGFFTPDLRYATTPQQAIAEFRTTVQALHNAGIEVILDVVYNHTAEGDEWGPTLSFRGIDNSAYYHLEPGSPGRYVNHTACGNTVNATHPRTQQLIMDSLHYWVSEMHVDGFRFDLAPVLCRGQSEVDPSFRFFHDILLDPVLSQVKLLVEPWDAGPGGYWLGSFPPGIREWNGRYRDCVRRFWGDNGGQLAEFASRLAGSSDQFAAGKRTPLAGVNYVTCHDGSTLHDLVSYERKHNQANGEENRDGPADPFGRNYGMEGPTEDAEMNDVRERMKRNLLATLVFSQGVPMLTGGDELGRTQQGNNNAYCQDNEISWLDWNLDAVKGEMLDFTRRVLAIRKEHVALRRDAFFDGRMDSGLQDVAWLDENGRELSAAEWHDAERRCLAMLIRGSNHEGHEGREVGLTLLILINAHVEPRTFRLPTGKTWRELLSTDKASSGAQYENEVSLIGRSLTLLESHSAD
jgi:glycogen operon protein